MCPALQKALDSMGDIVWCPRCQLPVIKEAEAALSLAHCTSCTYSFCTACLDTWHQVSYYHKYLYSNSLDSNNFSSIA